MEGDRLRGRDWLVVTVEPVDGVPRPDAGAFTDPALYRLVIHLVLANGAAICLTEIERGVVVGAIPFDAELCIRPAPLEVLLGLAMRALDVIAHQVWRFTRRPLYLALACNLGS
ncbi:hypothetical protein D3C75_697010 [compost metagenome]